MTYLLVQTIPAVTIATAIIKANDIISAMMMPEMEKE